MPPSYSTDIVIFGGGVAGLWLLNRLGAEGYRALLLERDKLGGGQSIHSQGIIHGGLKYALHGALSGASRAIADMPRRWRDCIAGRGEVDLSSCRVLSPHFFLWSGIGRGVGLKAFLGSKAVAGKASPVRREEVPPILRGRGAVYRLPDFVLDSAELIAALAAPWRHRIRAIDSAATRFAGVGAARQLSFGIDDGSSRINARRYIFCAGAGNQDLLARAGLRGTHCQLRPLKMVAASGPGLPPLFVHALDGGLRATPAVTITSHRAERGEVAWYLGGGLAEDGVKRSGEAQTEAARKLIERLFPEIDCGKLRWRCFDIDRAEAVSSGGRRPDSAQIHAEENIIAAWPTKLTLAPALADLVLAKLRRDGVAPSAGTGPVAVDLAGPPPVARPISM